MNLVRFNPRTECFGLRPDIHRFFDDFFFPAAFGNGKTEIRNPVVDVYSDDKNFFIKAELPGIDKKDITVDVKDGILTLRGERSAESETKEENYHRKERTYGKFERVFTLPADVDTGKIKADYKDGVLKIGIPKPEEVKPKRITIH